MSCIKIRKYVNYYFFGSLFYFFCVCGQLYSKQKSYLCTTKRKRYQLLTKLKEMFKTLLFTLLIIAICFVLLAITIIIKKNGRFPNTHVGGNKEMRKRGIKCAQSQDRDARKENHMRVKETNKK